jgi:hypothetical protein
VPKRRVVNTESKYSGPKSGEGKAILYWGALSRPLPQRNASSTRVSSLQGVVVTTWRVSHLKVVEGALRRRGLAHKRPPAHRTPRHRCLVANGNGGCVLSAAVAAAAETGCCRLPPTRPEKGAREKKRGAARERERARQSSRAAHGAFYLFDPDTCSTPVVVLDAAPAAGGGHFGMLSDVHRRLVP